MSDGLCLAIHQPNFLPRLKVLQKLAASDLWIVHDDVQFAKREWQNRAAIRHQSDHCTPFWITLPVHLPCGSDTLIRQVKLDHTHLSVDKIETSLRMALSSWPYWDEIKRYWDQLRPALQSTSLSNVASYSMSLALKLYAECPPTRLSSSVESTGRKSQLISSISRAVGASQYLADSGALNYLNEQDFVNTTVVWQKWMEPNSEKYPGIIWRDLSFLVYLGAEGPESLREHLMSFNSTDRTTLEKYYG